VTESRPAVAVIGGGPAGLMAAEVLAGAGAMVTVHEMHRSPGRKLLLAGRSGLNITHTEPFEQFLARYGPVAPALTAALEQFPPDRLRAWVEDLGQPTFVGSSGRVFPQAHRAAPLLRAWLARLAELGVEMRTESRWEGWEEDGRLRFATAGGESTVDADATVIAVGGASWPRVGSDGGWATTLAAHTVEVQPLRPANCGVTVGWSAVFLERFEGEPIKNVVVTYGERSVRGELVVTRDGLEGGPVYSLASTLGADGGFPVDVSLDLAPDISASTLTERLSSRRPKDSQSTWLRGAGLAPVAVGLLREATGNRIPDDPATLAELLQAAPLPIVGLSPLERAISTAGGVSFAELDEHLMLRSHPGVFLAGEMLDWDAPTGGYLLQACFSTGAWAGRGAAAFLEL